MSVSATLTDANLPPPPPPDPKRAGGKCLVQLHLLTNLVSVRTKMGVFNAQKLQFKTNQPFRPSITKKKRLSDRPTLFHFDMGA